MTHSIEVSSLAKADMRDILIYTQQRYGEVQRIAYRDLLLKTIESLAENPDMGHARYDLPAFYRAIGCKKHVVVYGKKDGVVVIVRVLHGTMDFKARV